jgi:hypothetical protein
LILIKQIGDNKMSDFKEENEKILGIIIGIAFVIWIREKYYSPRISKLILFMPILLIITGLSLGWLTKDTILRYREKLSFDKTAYGENSSKIGYGVKSYLKPSLNKGLKDIKRG